MVWVVVAAALSSSAQAGGDTCRFWGVEAKTALRRTDEGALVMTLYRRQSVQLPLLFQSVLVETADGRKRQLVNDDESIPAEALRYRVSKWSKAHWTLEGEEFTPGVASTVEVLDFWHSQRCVFDVAADGSVEARRLKRQERYWDEGFLQTLGGLGDLLERVESAKTSPDGP